MGSNAMTDDDAGKPAFTPEECDTVRDWVKNGGSLLLIADHAPFGGAAEIMAQRFGVDMSKGFTADPSHHFGQNQTELVFERKNGMLADHPITRGRNAEERLNRVVTFTGQSLKGPEGSVPILKLSDEATDVPPVTKAEREAAIGETVKKASEAGRNGGAQALRIQGNGLLAKGASAAGRGQS